MVRTTNRNELTNLLKVCPKCSQHNSFYHLFRHVYLCNDCRNEITDDTPSRVKIFLQLSRCPECATEWKNKAYPPKNSFWNVVGNYCVCESCKQKLNF